MKKEELIEELISMGGCDAEEDWEIGYDSGIDNAISLCDQLDELELPVIPQFVADWIEEAKGRHHSLYQAMKDYCKPEINQWIQSFFHSDTFARAWLDGYTIEPEKKYILKNKRGFVSSIKVKQSRNDLTSNIIFNYTPYQQDAYKFSQKEKEFYKDSFSLEEMEVSE